MRRFGLGLFALFGTLVLVSFGVLAGGALWVRGSLPPLDGTRPLPGLGAPATLERDSLGTAVLRAASWNDVHAALGFAHGQDRFFQMDLLRRFMGGELAELLGEGAVDADRELRRYGYREAARLHLAGLPPGQREALAAYTRGVNAGVASLRRRPPEYLLLRARPDPWQEEDSLLAFLYFYHALSTHYREEWETARLHRHLPEAMAVFLTPETSRFDQVMRSQRPDLSDPTGGYRPLPIPPASVLDLRAREDAPPDGRPAIRIYGDLPGGSNAWAVGTVDGTPALVAGDPHLPLQVPGIWYRAELHGPGRRVQGASVPGLPGLLVGMSDALAWSPTAAMVDQTDLVRIPRDADHPDRTPTPDGWRPLDRRLDTIRVRAADPVLVERIQSPWGPVLGQDDEGAYLALRSPAFQPGGVTLGYLELVSTSSVQTAVDRLRHLGGPGLGLVLGDAEGRVGWMVSGVLPARPAGEDGRLPVAAEGAALPPLARLSEERRPVVVDSAGGYVFTANQRFAPADEARTFSGHWVSPTRARRIAQLLGNADGRAPLEAIHYRHQLDTRSLEHEEVRRHLLELLDEDDPDPGLRRLRAYAEAWNGYADADFPHFRILEAAGRGLRDAALGPILGLVLAEAPDFRYRWLLAHEAAFRILEERPLHLLPLPWESWPDYLRAALGEVAAELGGSEIRMGELPIRETPDHPNPGREAPGSGTLPTASSSMGPVASHPAPADTVATDAPATGPTRLPSGWATPWGEVNRLAMTHPFSAAQPALGRFLDLPDDPLAGWLGAVRAQAPTYGQSLRFVGRPGRPEAAYLDLPGGQSGHPLSPFYEAGHEAWVRGAATPLAAGEPRHRLTLEPSP